MTLGRKASKQTNNVTFERGSFLPQEHNLNKLGRGLQGRVTYQISDSRLYGFRLEDFSMFFPIKAYLKCVTQGLGPFLATGSKFEQTWYRSTR